MTVFLAMLASAAVLGASESGHAPDAIAHCGGEPDAATIKPIYVPSWANLDSTGRRILTVGPGAEFAAPSDAAAVARDGDIVEIAAGTYPSDVASWSANDMWIRATGGKAIIRSMGKTAGNKGIWVISGRNTIVHGIRFEGARSTHNNGSGIRLSGHNLWVSNSEFFDNENHVMTWNEPGGELVIDRSVFLRNWAGPEYGHNVYVGRISRFSFMANYSIGAELGHHVKSRAFENSIMYNRIADGDEDRSSYLIDLPEGGVSTIIGNELVQGPLTENRIMISVGTKMLGDRAQETSIGYNTFVNRRPRGVLIRNRGRTGIRYFNNLVTGEPATLRSPLDANVGNVVAHSNTLTNAAAGDFRPLPDVDYRDSADTTNRDAHLPRIPDFEYRHPAAYGMRRSVAAPDPGAHETCGPQEMSPSEEPERKQR